MSQCQRTILGWWSLFGVRGGTGCYCLGGTALKGKLLLLRHHVFSHLGHLVFLHMVHPYSASSKLHNVGKGGKITSVFVMHRGNLSSHVSLFHIKLLLYCTVTSVLLMLVCMVSIIHYFTFKQLEYTDTVRRVSQVSDLSNIHYI